MAELPSVVVLGEILWDILGESRRLGGAPLNFAAHARSLGHPVSLISALGADAAGRDAAERIAELDLDTSLLQTTSRFATGTAEVRLGSDGSAVFEIARPAAYDAVELSAGEIEALRVRSPAWCYYGTLFAATPPGRRALEQLLYSLTGTRKLYDLNLRPGADAPELVEALLAHADVVKLNDHERDFVRENTGLPSDLEAFCRAVSERYGLCAVSVTLGERGCAMLVDGEYIEAPAPKVIVADTVGAGDAFAAAFMHGLSCGLAVDAIASLANRIAAHVASRAGSLPERGTAAYSEPV